LHSISFLLTNIKIGILALRAILIKLESCVNPFSINLWTVLNFSGIIEKLFNNWLGMRKKQRRGVGKMTLDELKQSLSSANIEEQKELLQRFAENVTERDILEGIRIANEANTLAPDQYLVSSHVKE